MAMASDSLAQNYIPITIEQAVEIALDQDPSMLLAELKIAHKEKLSNAGVSMQPTQISFSGEEFNFDGIAGVQSLNVQQTFNLPKVSRASKDYYKAQMESAMHYKELNKKELIRNVEVAYYRLEIAKREEIIGRDTENIYRDFFDRSKLAYDSGEDNKAPLLAAQSLLKKATLDIDHAAHEVEVAREILNLWLGTQGKYDLAEIEDPTLLNEVTKITKENPFLSIYGYEKEVIMKKIDMQKSLQLPQLNTGVRLQSVNGDILFFGYQVGVNIPLFNGASNRKVEATELELDIVETTKKVKEKEIERTTLKLDNHIGHLLEKIKYYDEELLPSISEQVSLLKKTYQQGEGSYMEYVMSLENENELRLEKLKMIQDFYLSSIELKYWTVNN